MPRTRRAAQAMTAPLPADLLLRAYAMGIFPMAESRDDIQVHWVDPQYRGIFPLSDFHISRRFSRQVRQWNYTIRTNSAFEAVVDACAAREETWINPDIRQAYLALHRLGHAHSLEVWREGRLAGGVYGVVLGAAFFGESMFSAESGGSKLALAWLVHRLRAGGFRLFDTQFLTPHLASLGAVEITRADYHRRLAEAIALPASFAPKDYSPSPCEVVSSVSGGA
ncbi:MAG: leucyl/phenylalanyl-tRNA--protein transferase [Paracoccaceae bacterium]